MKTLIIFSHTWFAQSKVNRALLEAAQDADNVGVLFQFPVEIVFPGDVLEKEDGTLVALGDRVFLLVDDDGLAAAVSL